MTSKSWVIPEYNPPYGKIYELGQSVNSGNSPRVNGKLVLRPNTLTLVRYEWRGTPYSISNKPNPPGAPVVPIVTTYYNSTAFPYNFSPVMETQSLRDKAIRDWYQEAGGFLTNIAEMIATRQQTVDMVTTNVRRLFHAYQAAKKFNWRSLCSHLGISRRRPRGWRKKLYTVPELWLEYIYGWKPLLSSIFDICKGQYRDPYLKIRKRAKRTDVLPHATGTTASFDYVIQRTNTAVVTAVGTVTVTGMAYSSASELGLTNPASLAWELLPGSFLIDWVLPVGPYLEQLTAMGGSRTDFASVGTMLRCDYDTIGTKYRGPSNYVPSGRPRIKGYRHNKTRGVGMPSFPVPTAKSAVSLSHFATAMSLLVGAFKNTPAFRRALI